MAKLIIPCLDIKGGKVVKGVNFEGVREVADPVEQAKKYSTQGADEIAFYDIAASVEQRGVFDALLKSVVDAVNVPIIVGGGINSLAECERVMSLGGSKLSINTGAIKNPALIEQAAAKYGSDAVIVSMDVKRQDGGFAVFTAAGAKPAGLDALDWAQEMQQRGAGALLINSIDTDGVKKGFDIELLQAILSVTTLPVTASGGAGCIDDFVALFKTLPEIAAALAASVFHFGEVDIRELKAVLAENGI